MQFSLYVRALLTVGLVLAGVTISFVAVNTYHHQKQLTHELETRLDRLTNLLAVSVADMVWVLDKPGATIVLSGLNQDPDFLGASITIDNDDVFARIGEDADTNLPTLTTEVDIRYAGTDSERTIGVLKVSFSTARLANKQWITLRDAILLGAVQLAAVLLVTALVLRRLTSPLEAITNRLVGLAWGKLDEDIPGIDRVDLIGDMARAVWAFRESLSEIDKLRVKDAEQAKELMDARDLLEQRVADRTEKLRQATQHLQDVAETAYDRFWETDKAFRFTSFTDAPGSGSFSSMPDLIGRTRWEYAGGDPDEDKKWYNHREDLRHYRRFRDFEYSAPDRHGSLLFFRISGKPIFDDAGNFTGYRGSATNITERKLVEIEQRRNEALINAVIEHSPIALSIKDIAGHYLYVSPTFAKYVGVDVAAITGENFKEVLNPAQSKIIAQADQQVIDTAKPLLQKDNFSFSIGGRSLLVTKFPILDEEYNVTAIGTVGLDVTEQEKARVALRQANDDLEIKVRERTAELENARDVAEAANELKSQLITTMSHELRTPLTSIVGTLRMLSQGVIKGIPDDVNDLIEIAWRNSDRLAQLVNDILDVERLSSGAPELKMERVDMSQLVKTAVDLNAGYASEHDVRIVATEVDDDATVDGDEGRLLQVLANLLSNASKFSNEGDQVETSVKRNGKSVVVSVVDHGAGIQEELRDNLFDKFVRGDTVDNRNRGGAGLGLGITKAIVEQHGGQIGFVTKAGKGTTFIVELPRAETQEAPAT